MDYQVAYYEDAWAVEARASRADVVDRLLATRDAVLTQLRLPEGQDGKVDHVSCGVWLKVRTDRPKATGHGTTSFVTGIDTGLHRPVPFSFTREPLQKAQIRLVELLPGYPSEPLRANLASFHLDAAPAYHALSYVWGNPELGQTIALGDGALRLERITVNLHAALAALRLRDVSRFIWVDALCINQSDPSERSNQVAIMGTIFSGASQVVIWLGQATEHSRFGIETLQFIADGKAFEDSPPWKAHPPEVVRKGLMDILNRDWFHRIWTVQESALSSCRTVVMCSDGVSCEWEATPTSVSLFIRGLKFAAVTADWAENGLSGSSDLDLAGIDLSGIISLLGQQLLQIIKAKGLRSLPLEADLLDIAYEVKDKRCTDPRDRLYAIQGLALIRGAHSDHQLQPDYTKSLHEVHDDFRRILLDAAKRESKFWVPDDSGQ